MKSELKKITQEWMELERKTSKQRQVAELFYEEKLMAEEGLTKTDNDLIHIGKPIPFDTDVFLHQLENLAVVAYGNDPDVRSYVEEIVPTYHAAKDDLKLHGETYKKLYEKAAGNK